MGSMFRKKKPQPPRRRPKSLLEQREAAPSVFSYHASRSGSSHKTGRGQEDQQERAVNLRKPRGSWLKRTVRTLIFLVVGALFVSNLMLSSVPKVVTVGATDAHFFLQDPKTYQQAAQRILTSSFFNSNKVTINVDDIRDRLKAEFPELADVSVALPLFGRQPVLYIQPSTSRILLKSNQGETFVLDGNGRAIATLGQAESLGKAGLPEVVDQSGVQARLGIQVMPSESIAFVTEVVRQLKAKQLTVAQITLPAGNSEMHVRLQDLPYAIKFNLQGNAREETGAFLATKEYVEAQKQTVNEYIDVRVESRVYYK